LSCPEGYSQPGPTCPTCEGRFRCNVIRQDWDRTILLKIVQTTLNEALKPIIDRLDQISERLDRLDEAMSGKVEWSLPSETRERLFSGMRGRILLMFMETRRTMDARQVLDMYRQTYPDSKVHPESAPRRLRELASPQYGNLLTHAVVEGKPVEGLYHLNPNMNLKQYDRLCQQPMPCVECTSLIGCAKRLWSKEDGRAE